MSDKQIKITAEQMRAVARYETTVSEIADFKNNPEVDVIFEQPFQITLDVLPVTGAAMFREMRNAGSIFVELNA